MQVTRERAERIAAEAFRTHGVRDGDAGLTAEVLVSADVRGKHSHGLLRLPRLLRGIEHGNVDTDGEIRIVRDGGAAATIDGGSRLGPVVATEAMAEATVRAAEYGVGAVGVHNSNHLGMLGYYTDQAQRRGYVSVALTNAEPAMPPFGGAEAILGTNPIAVGIPTDPPFNLDMSTSAVSRGELFELERSGGPLPEGVALAADGSTTTDPAAALEGVSLPYGGATGSGLAIAVEILAGGLVGAAMGSDVTGTYHTEDECTKGDLFVAFDPEHLGGDRFEARVNAFVRELKESDRVEGFDEIRLPGERSVEADRTDEVVDVDEALWTEVLELTDRD